MLSRKEELNKYSIFRVREIGREKGVKCPTKKRKGDVIEEIIAIENGRQTPYVKPNKKGRPHAINEFKEEIVQSQMLAKKQIKALVKEFVKQINEFLD